MWANGQLQSWHPLPGVELRTLWLPGRRSALRPRIQLRRWTPWNRTIICIDKFSSYFGCHFEIDNCRESNCSLCFVFSKSRPIDFKEGMYYLSSGINGLTFSYVDRKFRVSAMTTPLKWEVMTSELEARQWYFLETSWGPNTGLQLYVNGHLVAEDKYSKGKAIYHILLLKKYKVSKFRLSSVCWALWGFDREFLMTPVFKRTSSSHLTHYQTTNFRLFQTGRVCRRQFQIWRKWQKVIQMGRKHCGKRRNCSSRAISPFPHSVFKRLVSQGRQKVSLCGNGLKYSRKICA